MSTDWNSFFSTISQSASGMIALIAAFLISKLLGESEKQESLNSQMDDLKIQYNDIVHRVSKRSYHWLDKRTIDKDSDLENAIKAGRFKSLSDSEKLDLLYEIIPHLYRTDSCLTELKKLINELSPSNSGFGPNIHRMLSSTEILNSMNEEREKINALQVESYTLIDKFKKLKEDAQIAKKSLIPIQNIIWILVFGFFLAVIYPLHFMPMENSVQPTVEFSVSAILTSLFSFTGLFLIILSVFIVGIFGYFFYFIKKIQIKYKTLEQSLANKYLDVKSYCKYFR